MSNHGPILLVEDNPDDSELALHAFQANRIANRVIVKDDGPEALQYLFSPAETLPAVVLLDLKLPKISGIDVLRAIRKHERTRLLPVVVLTTSREEKDVLDCYASGANSYIVKPVDFNEFLSCIGQLGTYWLLLNESPPVRNHHHVETAARSHH